MPRVTDKALQQFCQGVQRVREDLAVLYADALEAAAEMAELGSARRLQHFMAQIAHESGGFRDLVESTNYRNPERLDALFSNVQGQEHARRLIAAGPQAIANTIYANKLGNGGVSSGDGFRFRGRGFMMITGRSNYREMGQLTGLPLEENPDLLGQPGPAAEAAARFWMARGINKAADANSVEAVTRLVNGSAMLHLKERKEWLVRAERVWT